MTDFDNQRPQSPTAADDPLIPLAADVGALKAEVANLSKVIEHLTSSHRPPPEVVHNIEILRAEVSRLTGAVSHLTNQASRSAMHTKSSRSQYALAFLGVLAAAIAIAVTYFLFRGSR